MFQVFRPLLRRTAIRGIEIKSSKPLLARTGLRENRSGGQVRRPELKPLKPISNVPGHLKGGGGLSIKYAHVIDTVKYISLACSYSECVEDKKPIHLFVTCLLCAKLATGINLSNETDISKLSNLKPIPKNMFLLGSRWESTRAARTACSRRPL